MRFDAETRMKELEGRANSATQAEAVAEAQARELRTEIEVGSHSWGEGERGGGG